MKQANRHVHLLVNVFIVRCQIELISGKPASRPGRSRLCSVSNPNQGCHHISHIQIPSREPRYPLPRLLLKLIFLLPRWEGIITCLLGDSKKKP